MGTNSEKKILLGVDIKCNYSSLIALIYLFFILSSIILCLNLRHPTCDLNQKIVILD